MSFVEPFSSELIWKEDYVKQKVEFLIFGLKLEFKKKTGEKEAEQMATR